MGFGQVMAAPGTRPFWRNPDRRTLLWSLASLGLTAKMATSEKSPEPAYRLLTPEGEVRMSVRYFASSTTDSFHFRDDLTKRVFCLSANGEEKQGCLERFVGSMAIACYDFRSRHRFADAAQFAGTGADHRSGQPNEPSCSLRKCAGRRAGCRQRYSGIRLRSGDAGARPLTVWRLLRQ